MTRIATMVRLAPSWFVGTLLFIPWVSRVRVLRLYPAGLTPTLGPGGTTTTGLCVLALVPVRHDDRLVKMLVSKKMCPTRWIKSRLSNWRVQLLIVSLAILTRYSWTLEKERENLYFRIMKELLLRKKDRQAPKELVLFNGVVETHCNT